MPWGLSFRIQIKTLTDREIDNIMSRIQVKLEKQIDARIRQAT